MVPAPKPADIRYEDETPADYVTRVLVVVERADGSVKEYEAREPQNLQMNDPESISAQVFRTTGVVIETGLAAGQGGGGFRGVQPVSPRCVFRSRRIPGITCTSATCGQASRGRDPYRRLSTSSPAATGKGS